MDRRDFRIDPRRPALAAWRTQRSLARIPAREHAPSAAPNRRGADGIGERHPDQTVVAVSHGDVIRSARLFALGMPLDHYNRLEVGQARSARSTSTPGHRVLAINERLGLAEGPHPPATTSRG